MNSPLKFACLAALAGLVAANAAAAPAADELTAMGRDIVVLDGDTIQIAGRVLVLSGVDAPELGQLCKSGDHVSACGLDAAYALRKLLSIQAQPVVCRALRTGGAAGQAICQAGERDVAETMAASGQAVVLEGAPASLRNAETRARKGGIGLWHSEFVAPAEWRRGTRLPAETEVEASTANWDGFPYTMLGARMLPVPRVHLAGCMIRAREADGGRREFAGPLDAAYHSFPAEPAFCSVEEAERSGWLHVGQNADALAVARN